jgi:uncharacterized protein YbjT (DUF2867 family)
MNVVLFGATGMVGQGVLRECLLDPDVEKVLSIGRAATGQQHAKLQEIVHADLFDFSPLENGLRGFDACFFCLGIASSGMTEEDYRRITYGITLAAAHTLVKLNPAMTFVYISGAGADSSGKGSVMWARVRGQTENALIALPFKNVYIFRPAGIVPMHGIQSRTRAYRVFYTVLGPILPLLQRMLPKYITTTEQLGRALLTAAKRGASKPVLESWDISALQP